MTQDTPVIQAEANFFRLADNPYPGRGFVIGTAEDPACTIQIYWIMGRSEGSRNRRFVADGGRVYTELADPTKFKGTQDELDLIIYNAMAEQDDVYVVSNGEQTDDALESMTKLGDDLLVALEHYEYEPDPPNFTPRITGVSAPLVKMGSCLDILVLRKSRWGENLDRMLYQYEHVAPGFGFCVTTYMNDGNPLPSFQGEPRLMPLRGSIEEIATRYWAALNEANRVALAVKRIEWHSRTSTVKVINKYT